MTYQSNGDYELKDDRGNLFVNKKKRSDFIADPSEREKNDKRPHWSGKLKLNGQEFWLSAWEKQTKKGELFYSVKLGGMVPAEPTMSQHSIDKGNGYAPGDRKETLDEEIPF